MPRDIDDHEETTVMPTASDESLVRLGRAENQRHQMETMLWQCLASGHAQGSANGGGITLTPRPCVIATN